MRVLRSLCRNDDSDRGVSAALYVCRNRAGFHRGPHYLVYVVGLPVSYVRTGTGPILLPTVTATAAQTGTPQQSLAKTWLCPAGMIGTRKASRRPGEGLYGGRWSRVSRGSLASAIRGEQGGSRGTVAKSDFSVGQDSGSRRIQ
jgi:hypothetical protein